MSAIPYDIAVIIPYYQRDPGILTRALKTVFAQKGALELHVFVVDDASPLPAAVDLDTLEPGQRHRVTLIEQENRGAGGARNTALAAIPRGVPWVAFLDSDDLWSEDHLARAVSALRHGYDFYFADNLSDEARSGPVTGTAFDQSGFRNARWKIVDPSREVFELEGDLFSSILSFTPIQASTVVFRNNKLGLIRFIESIRTCEDLLYLLDIADSSARVAFGNIVAATLGKGVNIYASVQWNTNEALRVARDRSVFFREVNRRYSLGPKERAMLSQQKAQNRNSFARAILSMLRGRSPIDFETCREFLQMNRRIVADLVRVAGTETLARVWR